MALLLGACLGFQFKSSVDAGWPAKSWEDADAECKAQGFDSLAKLTSKIEFEYLSGIAKSAGTAVWIGSNDRAQEGVWVWEDGTPMTGIFDPASKATDPANAAWKGIQPDNF